MLKPARENAYEAFENAVSQLLEPHNPKGTSLLRFIRRQLRRYHLSFADPDEILSESILRGLEFIHRTGEEIRTPEAWLRVTCLRLLQNKVRENVRHENLVSKMERLPSISNDSSVQKLELREQLEQLCNALKTLSEEDQEILNLYLVQNKTYLQIQAYYERKEDRLVHLMTIRKRVSRAKTRAIAAFNKLNTSISTPVINSVDGNEGLKPSGICQLPKD